MELTRNQEQKGKEEISECLGTKHYGSNSQVIHVSKRNLMEMRKHFELNGNENTAYQNCGILLKLYLEGNLKESDILEQQIT